MTFTILLHPNLHICSASKSCHTHLQAISCRDHADTVVVSIYVNPTQVSNSPGISCEHMCLCNELSAKEHQAFHRSTGRSNRLHVCSLLSMRILGCTREKRCGASHDA